MTNPTPSVDSTLVTHHCDTMKTASIRELKHDTAAVLGWVEAGEPVEIRRRGKLVAVMSPPVQSSDKAASRPDFEARLKTIYGGKMLKTTATELLAEERGDR